MEDFAATAEELKRCIEVRQQQLQTKLTAERRKNSSLQDLLNRMAAAPSAFDEDDRQEIERALAACELRLKKIQQDGERHETVRREKELVLSQLHNMLLLRSSVLDEADASSSVLTEHESLLKYFAQKQLSLTKLLKEKLQQMLDQATFQEEERQPTTAAPHAALVNGLHTRSPEPRLHP